jgi:site-specific DNA recombinase
LKLPLIRFVRGYAAKVEHMKIVERTQRGKFARANSGKLMAGRMPLYGYSWDGASKERYVINPEQAGIVRRVFTEAAAGRTSRQIAAALSAEGVPTPAGAQLWAHTSVVRILRNPMYAGRAYAFRHVHEKRSDPGPRHQRLRTPEEWIPLPAGTVPAIVDDTLYSIIEERLTLNKQRASRNTKEPEVALLRGGYVRCGHCVRSMAVRLQRGGTYRYICVKRTSTNGRCRHRSISTRLLDAAVWNRVKGIVTQPEIVADEIARLQREDPTEADLQALDRTLLDLTRRQTNLARAVAAVDDAEAAEPLTRELSGLSERKKHLLAEREAVLARSEQWRQAEGRLRSVQEWVATLSQLVDTLDNTPRRLALDALGISVKVYGADESPRYVITAALPLPAQQPEPSGVDCQAANVFASSRG